MSFIEINAITSVKSVYPKGQNKGFTWEVSGSYPLMLDPAVVTTIEPYRASPRADEPTMVVVDGLYVATLADGRAVNVAVVARDKIVAARNAAA